MSELIGITSILLVFFVSISISFKHKTLFNIILVALILRITIMLIGHYNIIILPDSTADAVSFEREAWHLAQFGFYYLIVDYNILSLNSQSISWLIAIPYSLIGRSALMAKSISLIFGIGIIFLGWKVAKMIWSEKIAIKVAWMITLFPSLVMYSVLILREMYVCFFILLATYGIVSLFKTKRKRSLLFIILGFFGATFFHGAMILGGIVFTIILGVLFLKEIIQLLFNNILNLRKVLIFFLILIIPIYLIYGDVYFPYLGNYEKLINIENLFIQANNATRGNASFPDWLKIYSLSEFLYKLPLRCLYFLFSPFIWDIKQPQHLIGVLDSFFYIYLVYLIFCNRNVIFDDLILKILLIISISYIVVFSIGVGNFGTAIRHKTKFVPILILLAAPHINRINFFKKKNL